MVVAGIAWMDMKLLRARLYSGSLSPGGLLWKYTAPISQSAARSLVAAFNGGFLLKSSNGGYLSEGHLVAPLRAGAASLVIYRNGSVNVGQWGRDVGMTSNVVSVRQNLTLLVEPLAARTLKQREGFDSKEKLAQWFHQNSRIPSEVYWDYQLVINYIEPQARKGVEPFASYLKLPKDASIPRFAEPEKIGVVVVGGEKNAYWFATDFGYLKSASVDEWR